VPYLGGLAILLGVAVPILLFRPQLWELLALLGALALGGLFDDLRTASVGTKLLMQAAVALVAVILGYSWSITNSDVLNGIVTVVWLVGLTNAFNLLDNMDGLSSSVAAFSLIGLSLLAPAAAPVALPVAGALAAFLLMNFPPARMFMGDAGSMVVGFAVGLCTVVAANMAEGLHSVALLALPVAVAVFDTSMVIISRLIKGRPIQLGGRDHFSHRLRLLGWSPRAIVLAAALGSALGSVMAYLSTRYPQRVAWLALPIAILMGAAWWQLLRIDPYTAGAEGKPEVWSA
jgi:UDP-GlcNAc:undecaprenyl-phosphate GlcNAc-1-phosphate transferase